jgi:cytochrome c oxidase assembly protein subunit 15
MFFFPISQWVGGIFYEHSHRLAACGVGLLTVVLTLWLYGQQARPFMRWAGLVLLLLGVVMAAAVPRRWADELVLGLTGLAFLGASLVWPRCEPSPKWLRPLWLYGQQARPFMRWAGFVLLLLGIVTAAGVPRRWADELVLGLTGLAFLGASLVWPRCEPSPKWLRRLGLAAFVAVVLQGVLGGLRVVLFKDVLGVFHAMLAQLFFVLLCAIALFTSRWWGVSPNRLGREGERPREPKQLGDTEGVRAREDARPPIAGIAASPLHASRFTLYVLTTLLILGQLILGAAMRHQHAGLAIPDFPLAYGKLWPAMDADSVARYNQQRIEVMAANPITAFQIGLQMIHRLFAIAILSAVAYATWFTGRALGGKNYLSRMALAWLGVILTQVALGAATIWSNKAADIATAHVLVGALSLAFGAILCIVSGKELMLDYRVTDVSTAKGARPLATLKPLASGVTGFPQS